MKRGLCALDVFLCRRKRLPKPTSKQINENIEKYLPKKGQRSIFKMTPRLARDVSNNPRSMRQIPIQLFLNQDFTSLGCQWSDSALLLPARHCHSPGSLLGLNVCRNPETQAAEKGRLGAEEEGFTCWSMPHIVVSQQKHLESRRGSWFVRRALQRR